MNSIVKDTIGLVIGLSILIGAIGSAPDGAHNALQDFNWEGKWKYTSDSGELLFIVHLYNVGDQQYAGHHSMIDGRIHGGAIDRYATDENGDIISSLTNSTVIDSQTLAFDFYSGYTASTGKAQLEVVDSNTILFRVPDPPSRFGYSPLGNLVSNFDGFGEDTTGGVKLKRQ